jgi:hypothetical protein
MLHRVRNACPIAGQSNWAFLAVCRLRRSLGAGAAGMNT